MSSSSEGSHNGGDNEDVAADESTRDNNGRLEVREADKKDEFGSQDQYEDAEEDQQAAAGNEDVEEDEWWDGELLPDGELLMEDDYAQLDRDQAHSPDGSLLPDEGPSTPMAASPLASPPYSASIPDDTPSQAGSMLSSPGRGASPLSRKAITRPASGALQPFERRFEARPAAARSPSSRAGSPAFLSPHSRQVSMTSQFSQISSQGGSEDTDTPQAPWEVVRWTKLRNITSQAFSESGKRSFGRPTCCAVSALIAVGTSKGLILGFDYHQTLKIIVGQGTKATECGSVTSLAIAADYSTIAAGHANGHIFTWEINRPSQPFLRIPPVARASVQQGNHADGHVESTAILHIGFLGTRHTALVSADAGGMAFSHLASRGLGPVTRSIKSTRLLGRYPPAGSQKERGRKPSSVLAFSPLPLGNVEQATDGMGLTALLTPYLLVVVSTTPIAQTQFKSPRPKEISPHGTLSGCLAWFPAVKLKTSSNGTERGASETKLVYCWSNLLTVLDVKILPQEDGADINKPPGLEFSPRSRWRADEAIVAVQWLGRSVLGVLTISQRLLIVEDRSLRVTDSMDLLHRHIYHQDLYSSQLQSVVESLDSLDPSLHGVVADAFYMSFRAYKGRMFLLGFNDLTVGTLSNWADRLMALMENGDHIAAIRLASEYYTGGANNVTVGLPDDETARHRMVRERLIAMVSASLNYTFSQHDEGRDLRLRELATVCFDACISMSEMDYLFGDVFEIFEDADEEGIFISTLEPYVLDGDVKSIPPEVVKTMVSHFISENQAARLEELLCRLDPHSFDLDKVSMLCRQHSLFDALIYIWTQAIGDFVTPLIDLMSLVKMLLEGGEDEDWTDNPFYESAVKTFPYLAYSLTSRRYPGGALMNDSEASHAKADLYEYLFSGRPTAWPQGSKRTFRTTDTVEHEPAFPYLALLLQFDAASFMSMLNEAFEDPFLNGPDEDPGMNGASQTNGISSRLGYKMTRQHVVSIMRDVMKQDGFDSEQTIYLDMFIARSLPKYPGQLVLSGSLLDDVLQRLCHPPTDALREECQLSVEYLLSAYHPPDVSRLISALKEARFYRVLKSVYRGERMFNELLETFFVDDSDKDSIFDCIAYCLRPSTALNQRQAQSLKEVVMAHVLELVDTSVILTARTLALHAKDLLQPALNAIEDSYVRFVFLRTLLEPALLRHEGLSQLSPLPDGERAQYTEQYTRLMCQHDPTHVADYVNLLPSGDLRLDEVLPALESSGVVDAAVVILARDGLARDAVDRLVAHLQRLQQTLVDLLEALTKSPDPAAALVTAQELLEDIKKYTKVGIWLCQGQTANAQREARPRPSSVWDISETDLDLDEYLWLSLIDVVVQISKTAGEALQHLEDRPGEAAVDVTDTVKLSSSLRTNVQQTFTALLASTATPNIKSAHPRPRPQQTKSAQQSLSFLRILRAFLTRASVTSPSLADLRSVLSDIFSAYTFEQSVLTLANDLLGSDTFAEIKDAHERRRKGWRPRTQVCETCKRRAWGPGSGEAVWNAWVKREEEKVRGKEVKALGEGAKGKGKARVVEQQASSTFAAIEGDGGGGAEGRKLALVVFACRHVFHRVCLDEEFRDGRPPKSERERYRCPLCVQSEDRDGPS